MGRLYDRLRRRARALLRKSQVDAELDEEIRLHIELEAEELQRTQGLSAGEARRRAQLRFGGVERVREAHRDVRGVRWLEEIGADLRYAVRTLRRAPAFTIPAVLTLGLGVGAATAVFSAAARARLWAVPFPQRDRLVLVWGTDRASTLEQLPLSYPNYADVRQQAGVFEAIGTWRMGGGTSMSLMGFGEPVEVRVAIVSSGLFASLGVAPLLGREFTAADDDPGGVRRVILGHTLWQRRFDGDSGVIGRSILLGGEPYEITGVMPAGFAFLSGPAAPEVWLPSGADPAVAVAGTSVRWARGAKFLGVVARLREGTTLRAAQARLDAVSRRLATAYPDVDEGVRFIVVPLGEQVARGVRPTFMLLLAGAGLLLVIGCGNVANLVLARGLTRGRELSMRVALGAQRRRVLVQLEVEALLLAGAGAVVGAALAVAASRVLPLAYDPGPFDPVGPAAGGSQLIGTLMVAVGVSAVATLITAAAPAIRLSREAGHTTRVGGRSTEPLQRNRARELLLIGEVALSLVLVVGALLLLSSLRRLGATDPGFRPDGVLAMELNLSRGAYPDAARIEAFYDALLRRIRSSPGVTNAAAVELLPLTGEQQSTDYRIEGRAPPASHSDQASVGYASATPGYFRTMGIRVVRGRDFVEADDSRGRPVAVINESMARHDFAGMDPIGQRIALSTEALRFRAVGPPILDFESAYREVVGVVADVKHTGLAAEATPDVYVPFGQAPRGAMTVVVKGNTRAPELAPVLRSALRDVDPEQPARSTFAAEDLVAASLRMPRLRTAILAFFAASALLLSVVGLYGVLAYAVAQRRREICVRLALGAAPADVVRLVLRDGMRLTVLGIAAGVPAALALGRLVEGLLYRVDSTDPTTFLTAILALATFGLVASVAPARRAACLDPNVVLRVE